LVLICLIHQAFAEYLPIQNPSFEDQALANGDGVSGVINAWSVSGTAGVFNWESSVLPDEAPEGLNTAYFNGGGQISQILIDDVQADSVYSLIVEIGDRGGTSFGGYTIELLAGAVVISSISHTDLGAPIPPDLDFTTVTINYEVQPADPVIGDSLVIRFSSPGTQTEMDAVRLARLDAASAIENLTTNDKFASIQAAIEAAVNGDVIEIPPGTYHEHLDLKGKSITLSSLSGDPNDTLIDGRFIDTSGGPGVLTTLDGAVARCTSGEDPNTVLDGLSISNGNGYFAAAGDRQGGGLYVDGADPTIDNCIFTVNNATRGGAAYLRASLSTFTNCYFILNTASNYAGGVYLINNSQITVNSSVFQQNTATTNAGAVLNVDSELTLFDCLFDTNSATVSDGGALYNNGGTTTVTACTFIDNTAGDQGGAIVSADTGNNVQILNSSFIDNSAAQDGGAIMNVSNSDGAIVDCTFTGNIADLDDGGAIFNLTNCDPIIQNCLFTLNIGDAGGAIMNQDASSPTIVNCDFSSNYAQSAGAVYNWTGASPRIAYCTFVGNRAANSGGAILSLNASGSSQPVIDHCLFLGNSAGGTVGAVNNNDFADTVFTHCTFTANSAPGVDGTLLIDNSTVEIHNCLLWDNDTNVDLKVNANAVAVVTYCDIEGGFTGVGNIDSDPLFVALPNDGGDGFGDDPTTELFDEGANDDLGDQRLSDGSPCIDAADSLFSASVDLDAAERAVDDPNTADTGAGLVTFVDIGAYERQSELCTPLLQGDINCDNTVDLVDVSLLSVNWLQSI
jgi:predicted outer membrane repeat protein